MAGWKMGSRALAAGMLWMVVSALYAQDVPAPDATVGAAVRSLAARAGVAFVGQVIAIERKPGAVEIHFRVEQPVLGTPGAEYTLREWAGLWPPGQMRYHVGDRALLFLRASASGALSSPVDGQDGVLPVLQPATLNASPAVDIRRVAARVLRAANEPLAEVADGSITLADAAALAQNWRSPRWHEPVRRALPGVPVPALRPPFADPATSMRVAAPVRSLIAGGIDAR